MALSVYTVTPFRVGSHHEKYLSCSFQGVSSHIVDLVFNEYIGKAESRAQVRDGLLDAIGDHMFVFSAIEVARYHRGEFPIQHLFKQMLSSILAHVFGLYVCDTLCYQKIC